MRQSKLTQSSLGATPWFPLDTYQTTFEAVVAVDLGGGSMTYNIEYTYADVLRGETPTAGEIFIKSSALTGVGEAIFESPVAAVRINVTIYTSGTATARVLQSGTAGR